MKNNKKNMKQIDKNVYQNSILKQQSVYDQLFDCECEEMREILSEALWYFAGNDSAVGLTKRVYALGIKHKEMED